METRFSYGHVTSVRVGCATAACERARAFGKASLMVLSAETPARRLRFPWMRLRVWCRISNFPNAKTGLRPRFRCVWTGFRTFRACLRSNRLGKFEILHQMSARANARLGKFDFLHQPSARVKAGFGKFEILHSDSFHFHLTIVIAALCRYPEIMPVLASGGSGRTALRSRSYTSKPCQVSRSFRIACCLSDHETCGRNLRPIFFAMARAMPSMPCSLSACCAVISNTQ